MTNGKALPVVLGLCLAFGIGTTSANSTATRVESVDVPFVERVNVTLPIIEHGPSIGGVATSVLAALFCLLLAAPCVAVVVICLGDWREIMSFCKGMPYDQLADEDVWQSTNAKRKARLFWEGTLAMCLPWVSMALGAMWLSLAHSRPPAWVIPAVALPFMVRAALLDRKATASLDQQLGLGPWASSKAELLDAVGDGLAVVAAAALPAHAHTRFAASLAQLPWLQGLLQLGLASALAGALAFATVVQAGFLLFMTGSDTDDDSQAEAFAADLAGFGALAKALENKDKAAVPIRPFTVGMTRVLAESAPQMLLQSSVLMAAGESLLEQPTVLASVLLSIATLLLKTFELARIPTKMRADADSTTRCLIAIPIMLAVALLMSVVLLTATKLVMIETCPDRLWGLSTGCIESPLSDQRGQLEE